MLLSKTQKNLIEKNTKNNKMLVDETNKKKELKNEEKNKANSGESRKTKLVSQTHDSLNYRFGLS